MGGGDEGLGSEGRAPLGFEGLRDLGLDRFGILGYYVGGWLHGYFRDFDF